MNSTITLDEAKRITSDYAAYARDASGLGNVVGALLVFASAAVPNSALAHWWIRILLGTTPFIWVLIKEQLRSRYYQQFGQIEPKSGVGERVYVILALSFSTFLSLISIVVLLLDAFISQASKATPSLVLSVLILIGIPFLAYRFMRGKYELITGVFLISQSVSMLNADTAFVFLRSLLGMPAIFVGIVMLFAGIDQHRRFLKLKTAMVARGGEQS
jgi:hypothetical protein